MAVFSTTLLLILLMFFFIRVNKADDYDDVTAHGRPHHNEDDVIMTRAPKSFDDVDRTRFLNVLERKLKTQRAGGGGGGEEVAGGQVTGSEVKRSRPWAENTMFTWGKRHRQLSPSRGKRSTGPYGRRRWSDHSMSSWGRKRGFPVPGNEEEGQRKEEDEEEGGGPGEWMPIDGSSGGGEDEGEVQAVDQGSRLGRQNRRWSEHSMSVWGKRRTQSTQGGGEDGKTAAIDLLENETVKESSSQPLLNHQGPSYAAFNEKSPHQLYFALLHQLNGTPKRNWATNTMNVWGKRLTTQDIQR